MRQRSSIPILVMLACAVTALGAAPASRPAGPFDKAIAYAQPRCVKIYGAGVAMEHGYACGTIISNDGVILTAEGIVLATSNLRVALPDGRMTSALVLRRSEPLQAALLKIDLPTPDYFDLSSAAAARTGDWVVGLNNAFKVADGTEPLSVNVGVVSLIAQIDAKRKVQDVPYDGAAIVIDAITSNPGAPGGALVNARGELVGMLGRILESKSTNTRLNYAVPADRLRAFVLGEQPATRPALAKGKPLTGISIFTLGGRKAPAYIDRVAIGSPAAAAGMKKDDLVLAINGKAVRDCEDYLQMSTELVPGAEATYMIKRKSQIIPVKFVVGQEASDEKP